MGGMGGAVNERVRGRREIKVDESESDSGASRRGEEGEKGTRVHASKQASKQARTHARKQARHTRKHARTHASTHARKQESKHGTHARKQAGKHGTHARTHAHSLVRRTACIQGSAGGVERDGALVRMEVGFLPVR